MWRLEVNIGLVARLEFGFLISLGVSSSLSAEEYFNELSEELILERIKLETEMKNRSDFLEKLTEIIKQS